ncbi:histidine--tRNA ligase [Methylophilaceae bacterium]|jgi:histidyl-tRNA synthetase|nr:histidine--tRNA ligase [Methylophilaceae bacterium]
MAKKFQSIKGFYDVGPDRQRLWRFFEKESLKVLDQYSFEEIGLPIVEPTGLFVEGVGTHTDIVEKEMYSWKDNLNEDKLTLRPEGTAGCVRAVIENSLTYNGPIKLFYRGPMFRHENVQKGRQRQFTQLGVETFGIESSDADAEQIILLSRLFKNLGLSNIRLELNTIGDTKDRELYRDRLIKYFEEHKSQLDEDSHRRLHENPLRILDSKNPSMQALLNKAPKLTDFISDEVRTHFDFLCQTLKSNKIDYVLNHRLVRGLDYYNRTVFEFVTSDLGSQGTVAGGGRYDYLIENLGGSHTHACGFAIGIERIILLLELNASHHEKFNPDVYIVNLGDKARALSFIVSEELRDLDVNTMLNIEGSSFKSQMKKADKSGAKIALIIGNNEAENNEIQIKFLRKDSPQATISCNKASSYVKENL